MATKLLLPGLARAYHVWHVTIWPWQHTAALSVFQQVGTLQLT